MTHPRTLALSALSALILLAGAVSAPALGVPVPAAYTPPDYIRTPVVLPPARPGASSQPRRMTLGEAIETALSRNLALHLQRERIQEIATGRDLASAAFEPTLLGNVSRNVNKAPPSTAQEGQAGEVLKTTQDAWGLTLLEHLPTGTDLRLDSQHLRAASSLENAVAPELFRGNLVLSLSQPVLRDFSFDLRIPRAAVLRAEFATDGAREEARLRALLAVKATEDAYWGLVASCKSYEVNVGAHELAQKQLELTRRQIAAGVLPESDLIGVEGTLAQRELAVVRAEAQIERAADQLRGLLNLPADQWVDPILPVDAPSFAHVEVPFATAIQRAVESRPELKQVAIDLRRIALDLDVAKNARLPRLDLRGSVGTLGQDTTYNRTLDDVGRGQGWQWSIGAALAWAPFGGASRAERRRLEIAARENGLSREQILVDMRTQIREALRAIDTAERQLYVAAKVRDLAERNLEIEQRRFLNGLSNNIFVAQRQAELAQARLSELDALIQHEKATSDLQLSTGELLEARHLKFEVKAGGA